MEEELSKMIDKFFPDRSIFDFKVPQKLDIEKIMRAAAANPSDPSLQYILGTEFRFNKN